MLFVLFEHVFRVIYQHIFSGYADHSERIYVITRLFHYLPIRVRWDCGTNLNVIG